VDYSQQGKGSYGSVPWPLQLGRDEDALESAHLRALSRVSAALCGLFDLHAILQVGLDSVFDLLEGAVGGILLVDEDTQTLTTESLTVFRARSWIRPRSR
jgi:hypothetical protein